MPKTTRRPQMTAEHKDALAEGRAEGQGGQELPRGIASRSGRGAAASGRPTRSRSGSPRSTRSSRRRSSLQRLQLVQETMDLDTELDGSWAPRSTSRLEGDFVKMAGKYAERKGIAYAAWRELGVSADVLKKAGIARS